MGTSNLQSLIKVVFPSQANVVFFAALGTGIALIGASAIFRISLGINLLQANLILCVGVALLLAAFGGQATVRIGSFILAGSAAIAVGLFVYLQDISKRQILTGQLGPLDLTLFKDPEIKNHTTLLGVTRPGTNTKRATFDFVIFRDELQTPMLTVSLPMRNADTEVTIRIPVNEVEWAFSDPRTLDWELQPKTIAGEQTYQIIDTLKKKVVSSDKLASGPLPTRWAMPLQFISSAFAQNHGMSSEAIDAKIIQLRSDDTTLRRGARDALSAVAVDNIPQVMQELRKNYSDYRVRLGICVALDQMLQVDKSKAAQVTAKLTEDDLRLLLKAAGDPDRTVRLYATEFLADLADPRASKIAIQEAATTKNEIARYNWLFVAQRGWSQVPQNDKNALKVSLDQAKTQSGPETRVILEKLQP